MKQILALNGLHFFANHGYYAHETENGGNYVIDIELEFPMSKAGESDQLTDTVNYEDIYKRVSEIMAIPKHLIETVCLEIIECIENEFKQVEHATVTVKKLAPPLDGKVDSTSVTFSKDFKVKPTTSGYWEERAKY